MREYGGWLRPAWYGPDDPERAIQREAARARDTVALFDGSSLGKIEIIGPDAAKLADFHSYNRLSTLKPGKIRYGFLLRRVRRRVRRRRDAAPRRRSLSRLLLVGPHGRGAHAPRTLAAGSFRCPPVSSFTTRPRNGRRSPSPARARATSSRPAGSTSRSTTRACRTWRSRPATFDGAPLRVARVSFTGDRSYELSVPARRAARFARAPRREAAGVRRRASRARGADDPARREGLHRRRQGHRRDDHAARSRRRRARATRGQDEYIGKRSLFMPVANDPRRKQFVGLSVGAREAPLPTGAHVTTGAGRARRSQGYVTSSYMSPTLGRPVALGLVEEGLSRMGETVGVYPSRRRAARDHRARGRARSGRKAAPCVRCGWPPARGGAGLLIDRPRLHARGLERARTDPDLGRSRRGGRRACARRADARPLCARARGRACAAHRPHERAAGHARAARSSPTAGATAGARPRRRRLGGGRGLGRGRAAGAAAGDLGRPRRRVRPRPPSSSLACAACSRGRRSGFRLHVEAPWLETLLAWLDGV